MKLEGWMHKWKHEYRRMHECMNEYMVAARKDTLLELSLY